MTELTLQQKMVIDNITINNEKTLTMSDDIRKRVTFVTSASSTVLALLLTAKILPSGNDFTQLQDITLSLVLVCSIAIYWCSTLVWKERNTRLPGTSDLDMLYRSYISKDIDVCFHNMLSDICEAYSLNKEENQIQSTRFGWVVFFFCIQLALLAFSITLGTILVLT